MTAPPGDRMRAARERRNEQARKQKRLEKARREALALVGCELCGATKDEIRGEQQRLRREFYSRHPELA